MRSVVVLACALVFLGCSANVIFLECMIKEDPSCGNMITFSQFLFIAMEGLFLVVDFGQKSPRIPIQRYLILVGFFFVVSILNNYALAFDIPLPLHMIFRAGSLMANMIMGIIILKKRYTLSKYCAVVMISVGIAMATIASAQQLNGESKEGKDEGVYHLGQMAIGIMILLAGLFASARMGIFQEVLYRDYGKHPREAMFYMHAVPLPAFLLLAPDISRKVISFSASAPVHILGVPVPVMWLYVAGNCITQYVCIRGVFVLTTECPSLFVTLVVTLRKFASLLFSIYYFQNPFTVYHWLATTLVFTGTALFAGLLDDLLTAIARLFKTTKVS